MNELERNNALKALEAASSVKVLKQSEDPRVSYLRMTDLEFAGWLFGQCEEGSAMFDAAQRIVRLLEHK